MRSATEAIRREGITIRSFRVVFNLERRIHKVDRWRIPVPYGVPLRGVAYWLLALLTLIILGRLPLVGALTDLAPTPIRLVIVPVAVAYALARLKIDGRAAHRGLAAWARFTLEPARIAALRGVPRVGAIVRLSDIPILPDERSAHLRRAVVTGPSNVLLRYPPFGWVRTRGRRPTLRVKQLSRGPLFVGRQVRLRAGQRMVIER